MDSPRDFFDRQERARKHTKLLEVYFGLAIIGMVAAFYLPIAVILNFIRASDGLPHFLWDTRAFLEVAGTTLGFVIEEQSYRVCPALWLPRAEGASLVARYSSSPSLQ